MLTSYVCWCASNVIYVRTNIIILFLLFLSCALSHTHYHSFYSLVFVFDFARTTLSIEAFHITNSIHANEKLFVISRLCFTTLYPSPRFPSHTTRFISFALCRLFQYPISYSSSFVAIVVYMRFFLVFSCFRNVRKKIYDFFGCLFFVLSCWLLFFFSGVINSCTSNVIYMQTQYFYCF